MTFKPSQTLASATYTVRGIKEEDLADDVITIQDDTCSHVRLWINGHWYGEVPDAELWEHLRWRERIRLPSKAKRIAKALLAKIADRRVMP